jgi:hypothetical protein
MKEEIRSGDCIFCSSNGGHSGLTIGKLYEVLSYDKESNEVIVIDDSSYAVDYPLDLFSLYDKDEDAENLNIIDKRFNMKVKVANKELQENINFMFNYLSSLYFESYSKFHKDFNMVKGDINVIMYDDHTVYTDIHKNKTNLFAVAVENYYLEVLKHYKSNFKGFDQPLVEKLQAHCNYLSIACNKVLEDLGITEEAPVEAPVEDNATDEPILVAKKVIKTRNSYTVKILTDNTEIRNMLEGQPDIAVYSSTDIESCIQKHFDIYIYDNLFEDLIPLSIVNMPSSIIFNQANIAETLPDKLRRILDKGTQMATIYQSCMGDNTWYVNSLQKAIYVEEDDYDRLSCIITGRKVWHLDVTLSKVAITKEFYETEVLTQGERKKVSPSEKKGISLDQKTQPLNMDTDTDPYPITNTRYTKEQRDLLMGLMDYRINNSSASYENTDTAIGKFEEQSSNYRKNIEEIKNTPDILSADIHDTVVSTEPVVEVSPGFTEQETDIMDFISGVDDFIYGTDNIRVTADKYKRKLKSIINPHTKEVEHYIE